MARRSVSAGSCLFLPRIITTAGPDGELLVRLGPGINMDGAEAANRFRSSWRIGDRVLISNIVGNAAADLVHLGERWRKERFPSRPVAHDLKRAFCLARFLLA